MQEVALLLEIFGARHILFYLLILGLFLALHTNLIVAVRLNSLLERDYLVIFERVVTVLEVQLLNKVAQVLLLALHINVVALKVFKFLLREHIVKLFIEAVNDAIDLVLLILHALQTLLKLHVNGMVADCICAVQVVASRRTTSGLSRR